LTRGVEEWKRRTASAALLEEIMVGAMRTAIGEDAPVRVDVCISDRWEKE